MGSYDHHVVRLCACICLIQILAGLRSGSDEETNTDPEEVEVQKLAKSISEVIGSSDKVKFKAMKVRKGMIRFLRCAALLFHYITDVPLPTFEGEENLEADDMFIYATLSEYLSLPKTMRELINHQDTFDLVHR